MPQVCFLKDEKNLEKKCGDDNSDRNLMIELEKNLIDKLDSKTINKSFSYLNDKLENNSICKTKFLVKRLESYRNDKMIKDKMKDKFNFKKSNNHIIQKYEDNVSYCKVLQ